MRYSINVKQTGSYAITCRMRQQRSGGKFRIAINGVYKTNEIKLNGSGSTWNEVFIYPVELQKVNNILICVLKVENWILIVSS